MAGGAGTRFWPFSRNNNPKQFHDVLGTGRTLLQQTADRFKNICPPENIYVVTTKAYEKIVQEQLPFLHSNQILAEPQRRNTAPCIAFACFKIGAKNPDANIVISPSDHIILKELEFENKINACLTETASSSHLVTLGISPNRPDTGYGYIQFENETSEIKKVVQFSEKPNLEKAQEYIASGNFVWNAGIFIWSYKTFENEFTVYMPEMAELFNNQNVGYFTNTENPYIEKNYTLAQNISIDYALLEKSESVKVVLCDIGWSDLGTWKSLHEASEKDNFGNVKDGNIVTYDTQNSIIKTPDDLLVVVQGLNGYIVAQHGNALMICKKEEEQSVKLFVEMAQKKGIEFS